MLKIIQKRKIFLVLSAIIVGLSLIGFFAYGLNYGIDFTGGSLLELEFKGQRPSNDVINDSLAGFELGTTNIQPTGDQGIILRFKDIDEAMHQKILQKIDSIGNENSEEVELLDDKNITGEDVGIQPMAVTEITEEAGTSTEESVAEENIAEKSVQIGNIEEIRFESVGPSIGKELKIKTFWSILVALIAIVIYMAWAFKKVSKLISSWKYGICAIFALFHDIMVVVGVFIVLGRFGVEVNTPFVAALLTILGYSVNDTIVIFDRVRENLPKVAGTFEEIVNVSINESLTRSLNTSITTFVALLAIYLFGGATIHNFILALLIGVATGTYSSIFIASPILVEWQLRNNRKKTAGL